MSPSYDRDATVHYTFRVISQQNMRDQHMWISVFMCPQHSTFTRVQRLSCGLAIILSSMFANIMYYEVSSSAYDEIIFDEFTLHLDHVAIGIQSAFVVVPVNELIVLIFRTVAVEEGAFIVHYGGTQGKDNIKVGDDAGYNHMTDDTDSDGILSSDSSTYSKGYIHKNVLRLKRTRFTSRNANTSANATTENVSSSNIISKNGDRNINQNRNIHRNQISASNADTLSNTVSSVGSWTRRSNLCPYITRWFTLPSWWVYIAWTLTVITCLVSSFFVVVYGLANPHFKNVAWILSFVMSSSGDVCVIQPVKIAVVVIVMTLLLNRPVTPTFEARKLENLGKYI